jgi:diaminohydroxyphosphoribosylaminopyrimidine deaminase / 5-amino-6-(5-phosphoribosylamino)uracil reductase
MNNLDTTDERFMKRALELARQGIALASPNPNVGAVVVMDGNIVGEGTHTYAGLRHAEVLALDTAGERARGATLYLNLEPCCHAGRTGPCVERVIAAGVRRVVAAMEDPNPLVAGKGFDRLRAAGIEVCTGIAEQDAKRLNEAFAKWIRTQRPLVTLKSAMTLDGKIAPPSGDVAQSTPEGAAAVRHVWITGELARTHVQKLRHQSDAILVGVGTAIADNPLLTDRSGEPRRRPLLRLVLDSRLRLPLDSRLVRSAQDDIVVFCVRAEAAHKQQLERHGVRVEEVEPGSDGRPSLNSIMVRLGEMEITSVLIEGGSRINQAALESGMPDKVYFYFAPVIMGGSAVPFVAGAGFTFSDTPRVKCITVHRFGEDFAVEGYLKDPY